MTGIVARRPESEDERVRFERVLQESFGSDDLPWSLWMERIGHENLRVLVDRSDRPSLTLIFAGARWRAPIVRDGAGADGTLRA